MWEKASYYHGNEVSPLHDLCQLLAPLRSGLDFGPEQVTAGQVSEAVLGDNLVALSSLAAAGAAQDPDDGQLGIPQRGLVNVLPL